jgi:tetratricopeptide (TPR) repeat protein
MNRKIVAIALVALSTIVGACATATRPTMTTTRSDLDRGLALYRDGRYDSAALAFDNAVRTNPTVAAYNNRAGAYVHMGHLVQALGDYTQAISMSPLDPELYLNRANVYIALGNYDFAIQDLNQAIRLAPSYSKAYFNRGTARLRSGDVAGADADWRSAIAMEPDPFTQAAMVRSAGLGGESVTTSVASIPATHVPSAVASTPPPPSALPAFPDKSVTPESLDARSLALRGVARELDGDHLSAIADLRAAHAKETDPARQAQIADLLKRLETR